MVVGKRNIFPIQPQERKHRNVPTSHRLSLLLTGTTNQETNACVPESHTADKRTGWLETSNAFAIDAEPRNKRWKFGRCSPQVYESLNLTAVAALESRKLCPLVPSSHGNVSAISPLPNIAICPATTSDHPADPVGLWGRSIVEWKAVYNRWPPNFGTPGSVVTAETHNSAIFPNMGSTAFCMGMNMVGNMTMNMMGTAIPAKAIQNYVPPMGMYFPARNLVRGKYNCRFCGKKKEGHLCLSSRYVLVASRATQCDVRITGKRKCS